MNPDNIPIFAIWAALAAAMLAACGEWLHGRRVKRLSPLAFGPTNRPRFWTRLTPALRVMALTAMAWSFVTLIDFDNRSRDRNQNTNATRHLMVLLDVSPSMLLNDSGESGTQMRKARAHDVLKSVLDRVPGNNVKFSVTSFYTESRPMVKECKDREVILALAGDTPLHITYLPGKTDILASLNQVGMSMKEWERKSTTLLVISDGDSVPPTGLHAMPSAVAEVIFAGIGDPGRGTFIDGHTSRQDTSNLSQLARRLGGKFYDCNTRQLPSSVLRNLNAEDPSTTKWRSDRRLTALMLLAVSTATLCAIPLFLEYLGSSWRPHARNISKPKTISAS